MINQRSLIRDENTQAVLNTDVVALNKYKLERALHRKVKSLTDDLAEVKLCLVSITERLDKIENN
jgi:hypothetical protein